MMVQSGRVFWRRRPHTDTKKYTLESSELHRRRGERKEWGKGEAGSGGKGRHSKPNALKQKWP
jgi:hypothetical protein